MAHAPSAGTPMDQTCEFAVMPPIQTIPAAEDVATSDISGISIRSSQRGYIRGPESVTVVSVSSDAEADLAPQADLAPLPSPLTGPAMFSGFGVNSFMREASQGAGREDLLPEPPGLGDPFCPTFSIDTPPGSVAPRKRQSVDSKADSSFSSSLYGPTPRVIPVALGPYPGANMIERTAQEVGQQKSDLARLASASGGALSELAAQARSTAAATTQPITEIAQHQSATESSTAIHLAELAQQQRASAAATASYLAELAQQQQQQQQSAAAATRTEFTTAANLAEIAQHQRAAAAATAGQVAELAQWQQRTAAEAQRSAAEATSSAEGAARTFAASQQMQAHSMNVKLNAL